jgi:hypothetical protein
MIAKHKLISIFSAVALCFVLGGSLWAYFALSALGSGPVILHFNDIDGITSIGGLGVIIFMGIFGVLVTLMNFAIALEFEERDPFFGKFLASLTLVFAVLLFIAFVAILSVNI